MKKLIMAAAISISSSAFSQNYINMLTCDDLTSNDRDVLCLGHNGEHYMAITKSGVNIIENYNVDAALTSTTYDRIQRLVQNNMLYFRITKMINGEYKLVANARVRGGGYGDDMDDTDYQTTVDQHAHAGRQIARAAKDSENQKAFVGGAAGGYKGGVAGMAASGAVAAGANAAYNASQGNYNDQNNPE